MNEVLQESGRIKYVNPINIGNNGDNGYTSPLEDYSIAVELLIYYYKRESCGKANENGEYESIVFSSQDGTINFAGGGEDGYLTTDFTNIDSKEPWKSSKECLGIKKLSIRYDSNFYPRVSIGFVDVRGGSLIGPTEMETNYSKGEGSFFKMLYSIPSPIFKLRVKGFYGNWVTYNLVLENSQLTFDSTDGDFEIDCDFIGYKYGIYTDIPMSYISCAPYIEYEGADYWAKETLLSEGRFKFYNAGEYVPMCTFPKLRYLISTAAKGMEYEQIENEQKISDDDFSKRISLLNEMINIFPFEQWNFKGKIGFLFSYDKNIKDDANEKVKKFNELIERYNKSYASSTINSYNYFSDIAIKRYKYSYNKGAESFTAKENISMYEPYFIEEKNEFEKKDINKYPYFLFVFLKNPKIEISTLALKKEIEKLRKEKEIKYSAYKKKKKQSICNAMGFPPTIRNIFGVTFAHIDTFMHVFYNYLTEIKNQLNNHDERRNFLHYDTTKSKTDSYVEYIPPFCSFYREVTRDDGIIVNEEMWPGELDNGSDLLEVQLVNSIINATKLYNYENSQIDDNEQTFIEDNNMNLPAIGLSIYTTLKKLYEKWICSAKESRWKFDAKNDYNANKESDFENFFFIDSFYQKIGDKLMVNTESVSEIVAGFIPTSNNAYEYGQLSVYSFLYEIAQKNGGNLMALPIYVGNMSKESMVDIFTAKPLTSTVVDDFSSFIFLYPYELSHNLNNDSYYDDDGVYLADNNGNLSNLIPLPFQNTDSDNFNIFAFSVDFAKQNQSFFKNLKLSMDNPSVTEASIAGLLNIASKTGEGPRESSFYGQNIFKNYTNYSFEVSMDMMGDAQIMPLMYFQLNSIPMWNGTYMIKNVSHEIVAGNMVTSFSGYRVNKNAIPLKDDESFALSDGEWEAIKK